jgi:hypothetical protein
VIFTLIELLAPKWVTWACLAVAVVFAIAAVISGDSWLGHAFWWVAGVLSGGAVSATAAGKIQQGLREGGPPPVRPPGHVEGDPLPPEFPAGTQSGTEHPDSSQVINDPQPPKFPPGTEVGPDHSPYNPSAP